MVLCWFVLVVAGCRHAAVDKSTRTVYVHEANGRYMLYRNGSPFEVKGASGFTNLKKLREVGGNTIRVWDTTNLDAILKEAAANNLAVVVGLGMPGNNDLDAFYNKPALVAAQFKSYEALVNRYKNQPALLFWCLGNELPFPYKPNYNSFYKTFNELVDMIHRVDPNHPVTTTMINFQRKNIVNIKSRTKIDFISFNVFGGIKTLNKELDDFKWFWDGPFFITEWGIDGPWPAHEHTAWGAYIENSSTKKAEQYLSVYQQYMPLSNSRFLGSMAFYWGEKQEYTPTWFSLFDENGATTETVGVLQYIWSGGWPIYKAPQLKYMLLDDKGASDNLFYKPGVVARAKLLVAGNDTAGLTFKWAVLREDWFKIENVYSARKMKPLDSVFVEQKGSVALFRTPAKEGPYRVYVYVYDHHGNVASCNTPFYVIDGK